VGFSATDVVGHTYGADSQEVMDQLLRLDQILDRLFKEIDSTVGLQNTVVVLTADHGSLPLVEVLQARGIEARRVSPAILETAVREAFARRYPGVTDLIANFATDIYLNVDAMRRQNLAQKDVEATAIAALMATGVVEHVYTQTELMSEGSPSDPYYRLYRNSFFAPRSPDLSVLLKRYIYGDSRPGGTGHGTPYDYDRHVPIIFMGSGVKPGSYAVESGPEDIAPTLASMLGLQFPKEPDARLLSEMLAQTGR